MVEKPMTRRQQCTFTAWYSTRCAIYAQQLRTARLPEDDVLLLGRLLTVATLAHQRGVGLSSFFSVGLGPGLPHYELARRAVRMPRGSRRVAGLHPAQRHVLLLFSVAR